MQVVFRTKSGRAVLGYPWPTYIIERFQVEILMRVVILSVPLVRHHRDIDIDIVFVSYLQHTTCEPAYQQSVNIFKTRKSQCHKRCYHAQLVLKMRT
jgi:hypothetical protein